MGLEEEIHSLLGLVVGFVKELAEDDELIVSMARVAGKLQRALEKEGFTRNEAFHLIQTSVSKFGSK